MQLTVVLAPYIWNMDTIYEDPIERPFSVGHTQSKIWQCTLLKED